MTQDRWTAAEYRHYLETGEVPRREQEETGRGAPGRGAAPGIMDAGGSKRRSKYGNETVQIREQDGPNTGSRRSKYGNERVEEDGIVFDSKHERNVYRWLKERRLRGELKWVFVHIPFRLINGTVYWADFMTVLQDGRVEAVWDAKSGPTARKREYINKAKSLKAEWGITIREVMREDADGLGGYHNDAWEAETP